MNAEVSPPVTEQTPTPEVVSPEAISSEAAPTTEPTPSPPPVKRRFHFSWLRFLSVLGTLIGLLLIIYGLFFAYFAYTNGLPVQQVKVIGTYQYVNEASIQKVVNPFLLGKGLFAFPEWQTEKALEQLPGVADASIWRMYPDTIRIILREKSAAARLPDGQLLATDGTTFKIDNLAGAQSLPLLNGSVQYAKQMLAMYDSISPIFNTLNLNVTGLGLAENGDWSVQVNNQTWIILGKSDLQNRLINFFTDYPVMMKNAPAGQTLATVDLRYTHGFTASWQKTLLSAAKS